MGVVIGQGQTQHQGVHAKDSLEVGYDGNRAAFAQQNRLMAECGLKRTESRLRQRSGGRDKIGFPAVAALDLQTDGWRTNAFQMLPDKLFDASRMLIRDESERELGAGPGRNDGLAPFALITTGETVDFNGGTRSALFLRCEPAFAKKFRDAEKFAQRRVVVRDARRCPQIGRSASGTPAMAVSVTG